MTSNLVQRLRVCSADERRVVAMRLAQTGTDEAVTELIRVVERRRKRLLSHYSLDDQLLGVESLGETSSQNALNYLRQAYTPQVSVEERGFVRYWGIDPPMNKSDAGVYWKVEVHKYPNAPLGLVEDLTYEVPLTTWSESYDSDIPLNEIEIREMREDVPAGKRTHQIFRTAISKLESSAQRHI